MQRWQREALRSPFAFGWRVGTSSSGKLYLRQSRRQKPTQRCMLFTSFRQTVALVEFLRPRCNGARGGVHVPHGQRAYESSFATGAAADANGLEGVFLELSALPGSSGGLGLWPDCHV